MGALRELLGPAALSFASPGHDATGQDGQVLGKIVSRRPLRERPEAERSLGEDQGGRTDGRDARQDPRLGTKRGVFEVSKMGRNVPWILISCELPHQTGLLEVEGTEGFKLPFRLF